MALRSNLKMLQFAQQNLSWPTLDEAIRSATEPNDGFDYLALASRCKTQNMFNRLHIELENICTPLELVGIANLADKTELPIPTRKWLRKLGKMAPGLNLLNAPQGYERQQFSWSVMLYQDSQRDVRHKGLLVAFASAARRIMMPISVFLQHVDSRAWDVLVLKRSAHSYLLGLEGISTDLPGLTSYVDTTLHASQYRRVMTLGVSAGGFAAIWAAILMGADRGISVGGCPPRSLPTSVGNAPHQTDLRYVYGSAQDHRSALAMKDMFGGRLCPVPDVEVHGVLGQLMKRGQFGEFLNVMLA